MKKQLIKFSKPSFAIIKNKESFFNENDRLLENVKRVNNFYLKQPKRKKCKTCSNSIKETHLTIHGIPYSICKKCGHLNGLHEDTIEFSSYLYSENDGEDYAINYKNNYTDRVHDIYKPKVKFLMDCLLSIENIMDFDVTDIGCGGGHFVKALEDYGVSSVGFDTNKQLINFGNEMMSSNLLKHINIDEINRYILNSQSKVLSLVGVLEHLNNPIEALKAFKQSGSKYLYLQVPLFSFSALLESIHPSVFPRQLNTGHTHLYTESSIDFLCKRYELSKIGEWWFGSDMVDLFRHLRVLMNSSVSVNLSSKFFGDVIDDLQSCFDRKKICSGVNMILKKK